MFIKNTPQGFNYKKITFFYQINKKKYSSNHFKSNTHNEYCT